MRRHATVWGGFVEGAYDGPIFDWGWGNVFNLAWLAAQSCSEREVCPFRPRSRPTGRPVGAGKSWGSEARRPASGAIAPVEQLPRHMHLGLAPRGRYVSGCNFSSDVYLVTPVVQIHNGVGAAFGDMSDMF